MCEKKIRLLIITDNFLVGGRETYLDCYTRSLRSRADMQTALVAQRVENITVDKIFDEVYQVSLKESEKDLEGFLNTINEAVADFIPDVLWVQHYNLLPAWLVSVHCNIPLLYTMHGPLLSAGRLNRINDQLGLACMMHYEGNISGVSIEIADQIASISGELMKKHKTSLIVNAVDIFELNDSELLRGKASNNFRVVLLARRQKLEHIRAATKLFVDFLKKFPNSSMVIHTGIKSEENFLSNNNKENILKLLGKKWMLLNPSVYKVLERIKVEPLTQEVQKVIKNSDIVFGMGRVVLEGIALRKPTVLVGYDKVISAVNDENFSQLQSSNFSGRDQISLPSKEIIKQLTNMLSANEIYSNELISKIDVNKQSEKLEELLFAIKNKSVNNDKIPEDIRAGISEVFENLKKSKWGDEELNLNYLRDSVSTAFKRLNNIS